MSGTDHRRGVLPEDHPQGPAIILVEPQLGMNIGTSARAMLNCGLTDLRIVNPRDGWPSEKAMQACSGALLVIENAQLFDTVEDAIADLNYVIATTARDRDMIKTVFKPEAAAAEIHKRNPGGQQNCGIMFGPERSGLDNNAISLCNAMLHVPLNPGFSSLNLAQAVLLVSHAWYAQLVEDVPPVELVSGETVPAKSRDVEHLMRHLEDELEASGFFASKEMQPTTMRNIRNMFGRMDITEQEVRTFHGIISTLSGRKTWKSSRD